MVLLSAEASSSEMSTLQRTEAGSDDTNVVSLAFCESSLPVEDRNGKKTLGEVHTYAELKHDRSASLPDSFTVCSTIMNTGCQSYSDLTFFNILDNNNDQCLLHLRNFAMSFEDDNIKGVNTVGVLQKNRGI